jgi:DNA end-binding protein Ku
MLEFASHIVNTKAGHFDPTRFEDHYEDPLKDLLKKKQEGKPIERVERRELTNVVNLMDALRKSGEASRKGQSQTRRGGTVEQPKKKKSRRSG